MKDYEITATYPITKELTTFTKGKNKKDAVKHLKESFGVPIQVLKVKKIKKAVDDHSDFVNASDLS